MRLNFIKASPSQNTTAFVVDYVPPAKYAEVAQKLMDYDYLNVEQVGFLMQPNNEQATIRLEMSGGEFCGNALLSAAAYCRYRGLSDQENMLVEISGSKSPHQCYVKQKGAHLFHARSEMPQSVGEQTIQFKVDGELVTGKIIHLQGISHFITDYWPSEEKDYMNILDQLLKNVMNQAIGIIPYRETNKKDYEITPLVYVPETGSKVFERACGSGTLALGIHLKDLKKQSHFSIDQPGGMIEVEIRDKNYISTDVAFTCEGIINI